MTAKKSKQPKPKAPAKSSPEKDTGMDERGHLKGSRKGRVHACFVEQDEATAYTLAIKLGLKPTTARSWFTVWKRSAKPAKATKVAKPKVEKKPETKPADKPAEATVAA